MDPVATALATARTYDEVVESVGQEALTVYLRGNSWAILAAPELWLLLSEYLQSRRLDDAERDLIRARTIALDHAQNAEATAEEDGSVGEDAVYKRSKRRGTDLVALSVNAVTNTVRAQVDLARARLSYTNSLQKRLVAVSCRLDEIRANTHTRAGRGLNGEEVKRRLMAYIAQTDPRLEVALAFARAWTPSTAPPRADDGTAFDSTGQPETVALEHALPTIEHEIAELQSARRRALSAGDFGAVATLSGTIATVEARANAENARTESSGDGLLDSLAARLKDGAKG